jgi:hypothetical protein
MKRHMTMSSRLMVLSFAFLCYTALPAITYATSVSISVSGNEGAINVSADASFTEYPDSNAGTLSVYRNNSYLGSQAGNGSARWSTVINGGLLPQGSHTFSAIARDSQGDSDKATRTIIIDNTPNLTVQVGEPEGDMQVRGTVDFKENITGAEGSITLYIQYNGGGWSYQGQKSFEGVEPIAWAWEEIAASRVKLNAGTMPQGNHTIKVRATAANGKYIDKDYPFTIDNTPDLTVQVGEPEGDMQVRGTVDFKENITGAEGSITLYIQYNGGGWSYQGQKSFEGVEPIAWAWEEIAASRVKLNAGTMPQGNHTIKVRATAANGKYIDKDYPFTIDNTPDLTVQVGEPEGDMQVQGTVDFKENITGGEGSITLYIQYNGGGWSYQGQKSFEGVEPIAWAWEEIAASRVKLNAGTMPQGNHTIKVRATAANGKYIDKDYPFTIDNTPDLTVQVGEPEGDMQVQGTVDFKENITGAEGSITLYIQFNGGGWSYQGQKSFEGVEPIAWAWEEIAASRVKLNAGTMPQGNHTIKVRATAANGIYIDKDYPFTIDNTPDLTVQVGEPEGDMQVRGTVDFKENITGAEGSITLYIQYNGGGWSYQGQKSFEGVEPIAWTWEEIAASKAKLNAGTMPQGNHTIKVRATAANGIYIDKDYPFTIDNTPKPTIDGNQEFPDNTTDIFGTVLFKENNDGNPTTQDLEGTVTVYLAPDAKSPTFSQHGATKSYEGTSINWKYSDFTGSRLPRDVWGRREYLIKVVATAANGATATVIHNPMILALGPPSCNLP